MIDGRVRDHADVIQIRSSDSNRTFDLQGDSGALVLNVDNEPVALLFARRTITDPKEGPVGAIDGLACYLEDHPGGTLGVLNAMDIDFISGGGPTAPPITVPSGNLEGVDHRDSDGNIVTRGRRARGIVDWADAQLRASAAGATLASTRWERRHEIVMLIKRSRSFRKDWHRYSGPTLMQELRTCLEQPDRPLPNNIRRGDTDECVHQLLISLRTHASADLIRDIDQHGTRIGSLAGKTFSGFLQELADGP